MPDQFLNLVNSLNKASNQKGFSLLYIDIAVLIFAYVYLASR